MNINALRDDDNDPGFYAVATSAAKSWPGATMYQSSDSGSSYQVVGTFAHRATMGKTLGALGDYEGGNTVDEINSVVVKLTYGTLASVPFDGLLEGMQAALIRDEVVYFRDAVLIAPQTYRVSGYLRGRRGTEWAMSEHGAGDRFVLLTPSTVKPIPQVTSDIGKTRLYKMVTSGASLSSAPAQAFTNLGARLKPYAPVLIGGGSDADGNLAITWTRRTRISGEWKDGLEVPLGEASEAYEVDIMDAGFTTVIRTISGLSSPTAMYSAVDQAADGIGPTDPVYIRVYQLSSTVGRGYPGRGALRHDGAIAGGTIPGGSSGGGSSSAPVAPTLTSPSAIQTGTTTASGSVTTNQATGTLHILSSPNPTATRDQVKTGLSQAVTASGVQYVSIGGLASGVTYYPHYLHRNSAGLESEVVTGPGFTTTASSTGSAPSAQAVAVGSQIAPMSVENTSTSAATDQPFTLGHVFAQGHLPASGAAITLHLPDNTAISAQINVKATHADGSVRHAIVSGVMPTIAAGAVVPLSMKRASTASAGTNVGLPASLPSATLNIGGATYTAAPTASTPYITWLAGPVASDFVFNVPFVNGSGTPHPTLTAQFSVRAFATGHVRVDYVIEHCQAYTSTADITYDATLYAAGQPVYTRTALVHTPTGRWKKTFWQGAASSLHVKHDIPYLLDSRQVPNYDRSITIAESYLAGLATDLASGKFDPMKFGRFQPYMPNTGGRPDIGLMPDSHAALLLSMDKRARAVVLAAGDIGGSWPMCRRDDSTGPGRGYPLSVVNFPYASIAGNPGDCNNPATGKNEHLPALTSATVGVPDSSHQPDIYYLPYLLTGDYFYLEGLHFACTFNHYQDNPYYRDFAKANVHADQLRGQAWSLRTMAECAAITPDDHYLKSHFTGWYSNNMAWYAARYLDATDNVLGIITNGYVLSYTVNNQANTGMPPWMDDFFTQSLGHQYELLGLDSTKRLLTWKAKFQIGRMNDPAVCVQNACIYALGVRNTETSPFFSTLAECFNFTVPATQQQYPCGSTQRLALANTANLLPGDIDGYPASESGYPANYQPALAAAASIGYPGGAEAWAKFMARPTKPNYGLYGAQFAVVPRVTGVGSGGGSGTNGTIFVSPSGSDANTGTSSSPVKTLARAHALSVPGSVIVVADGTYQEPLNITNGGTAPSRVRWTSQNPWGAKVVPASNAQTAPLCTIHAPYVDVEGFDFDGSGNTQMRIGVVADRGNAAVRYCHIHNIADAVGTSSILDSTGGAGLWCGQSDSAQYNNYEFNGNVVHDIGRDNGYFPAIYFQSTGKVINNVCFNTSCGVQAYHDDHDIQIANNTIVNTSGYAIIWGGGYEAYTAVAPDGSTGLWTWGIKVYNNIIHDCANAIQGCRADTDWNLNVGPDAAASNEINRNLISSSGTSDVASSTPIRNSLTGDPLFVAYSKGADSQGRTNRVLLDQCNFHLQSGSPAIGTANASYLPTKDQAGTARPQGGAGDLGALES